MFEKATCLLTVLGLLLPAAGHASRPVPFCRFSTAKDMTIVGHRYRIADAYEAADLVVVGESLENPKNDAPQKVEVIRVVKRSGKIGRRIELVGPHCQGTACSGFAILPDHEMLLLLRKVEEGRFHKVDGDGNDACPNVFGIEGGKARIGKKDVPVEGLRSYFTSHPEPIPYP